MSYQVLARKWRPRTFDEVVGQPGVTQTLKNAIATGRLGQSFIFAGARGVGKTTTARILAKALNCVNGPTVTPCLVCDACVEITEGRDLDVLEIDAATHTQVDTVREVIIQNLGVRPVRDRYRVFIIDEVHMLSTSSFNALLKSVEEPPPHVVFVMATTELHKIPDTIRSRSQEFEFRTIGTRAIADQLRKICDAEGIDAEPAAIALLARAAEGSLRDAESALDQVLAFSGSHLAVDDATTVLGLVGRDLLLDIVETVAAGDAPRVFDLASRAVESGQDLRLICRELARVTREMMIARIDPARLEDPEFAPEGDAARLVVLADRFAPEDLMRSFDLLSRAEFEIRGAAQPRYHLEMALLKWIHLRKMVPLTALIESLESGSGALPGRADAPGRPSLSGAPARPPAIAGAAAAATARRVGQALGVRPAAAAEGERPAPVRPPVAPPPAPARPSAPAAPPAAPPLLRPSTPTAPDRDAPVDDTPAPAVSEVAGRGAFEDAFLDKIRQTRKMFHGTVIAHAQRIEFDRDTVRFTFGPHQGVLRRQFEQSKSELEQMALAIAGRRIVIAVVEGEATTPGSEPVAAVAPADAEKERLKQIALADNAVQAMLDVFPAEIRDVEEIEGK